MPEPISSNLHAVFIFGSASVALMVILIRLRAAAKPVNVMKILMPTVGMSTGFGMFFAPFMRIPLTWALCAFAAGALFFSYPLIRTSRFQVEKGKVYLKRSKAFIWILLLLFAVRLVLHEYVESMISIYQTGSLFFLLAFGMLLPWRISMYVQYRKLIRTN